MTVSLFNELPVEIQVHILGFVTDSPEICARIEMVCKAWQAVVPWLWTQLGKDYGLDEETSSSAAFQMAYQLTTRSNLTHRIFQAKRYVYRPASTTTQTPAIMSWNSLAQLKDSDIAQTVWRNRDGGLDLSGLCNPAIDPQLTCEYSSMPGFNEILNRPNRLASYAALFGGFHTCIVVSHPNPTSLAWLDVYQLRCPHGVHKRCQALPKVPYLSSCYVTPTQIWLAFAANPEGQLYSLKSRDDTLQLTWHCSFKPPTKVKQLSWLQLGSGGSLYLCGRLRRKLIVWPLSKYGTGVHMLKRGRNEEPLTQLAARGSKRKANVLLEDRNGFTLLDFTPTSKRRKTWH